MKALFVPFAPSLAHVSRCLAVAEAWRASGHEALFALGPERGDLVRGAGFAVETLPEVPAAVFRADRGFAWLTRDYAARNLAAEKALLARLEPDVVLSDFRFTTATAAADRGVPAVSILHGNALALVGEPRATARRLIGESAVGPRATIMRTIFPLGFAAVMGMAAGRVGPVLNRRGRSRPRTPFDLLVADDVLVADLPEFLPARLPIGAHLVGPLLWSGWDQPVPWLDELDTRPLVYVTMGSTVATDLVLASVLAALAGGPYQAVVTTAGVPLPRRLDVPPNVRLVDTVPGGAVARRAAVVLHHGGHETLLQALAAGVPSVVLPVNPDQILLGQDVERLRLGRTLRPAGGPPIGTHWLDVLPPAELRRALDEVIGDARYRAACAGLRRRIEPAEAARASARVLAEVAAR